MGDISFATFDQFADILEVINENTRTTFYIQSKNPVYFAEYLGCSYIGWAPDIGGTNVVLGTTIETNSYQGVHITPAPSPILRYHAAKNLCHCRKSITIEPIMDFDPDTLEDMIAEIRPEFVYIGYLNPVWKAKKLQIPEPPLEKTEALVEALKEITEVRLKTIRRAWWEKCK